MYINHLQIFSRELFDEVGGYREGFEGSQDHDLALRMSEIMSRLTMFGALLISGGFKAIHNLETIPRHSRCHHSFHASLVRTPRSPRTHIRQLPLLGMDPPLTKRIVPKQKPRVSIIIPCRLGTSRLINGKEINLLEHCLQSIRTTVTDVAETTQTIAVLEVILVLNHEDDTNWGNMLYCRISDLTDFL